MLLHPGYHVPWPVEWIDRATRGRTRQRARVREGASPSSRLFVEEVVRTADLEPLGETWEDLERRADNSELFTSRRWLESWLEAFWPGRPIAFQFVWRAGRLVGLLPLLRDEDGALWCHDSLVTPVNPHTARLSVLSTTAPDEILEAVYHHLRRTQRSFRLGIKHISETDPATQSLLRLAGRHGLGTVLRPAHHSPFASMEHGWDQYVNSLTPHFRGEMRRRRRIIDRSGTAEYRVITRVDDVDAAMRDVVGIETASWKHQAGTSWASRPPDTAFFLTLARRCARADKLRLYLLVLDGRPIAYHYTVGHRRTLYTLHTSYRADARQLAPGIVLTGHLLRDACTHGYTAVDFLGDGEPWKRPVATGQHAHISLCLFARRQPRCMWCRMLEGRIKPMVRATAPGIVEWKRRLAHPRDRIAGDASTARSG